MRRILVSIAVLLALGSLVTASAATVGSVTGGVFGGSSTLTAPAATRSVTDVALTTTGGPPIVTALTATVTGTGLATLAGESATIDLLDPSGAALSSVTATLATGTNLVVGSTTATITLPVTGSPLASTFVNWIAFIAGTQNLGSGADPTQRAVTVGNGALAAVTWTAPVIPPTGTTPGTTIVTITPSNINVYSTCLTVAITGTSSTPVAWGFAIDYSKPPYYGYRPTVDSHAIVVSDVGSVLSLKGTSNGNSTWEEWGNNALISNAQTLNIGVCSYSYPSALPAEPQAYSVSSQVHGATWTNTKACIDRTITGNGIYPFFFGWSTVFDMTDAIALLKTNDAGSPRAFVYQPNPTTPGTYTAGTTSYAMTENTSQEISGTQSVVAELCVSQY